MPAQPVIYLYHGVSGLPAQDFTGKEVRYKRADNSDPDLNNPIVVPSSGISYSYPKHTRIGWTTSPNEIIRNLVWFADPLETTFDAAQQWDGMTLYAGIVSAAAYSQGVTADTLALRAGMTDSSQYTSAAPLSVVSGDVIGAGETGTGLTQPYVLTQLAVLPAALSGVKGRRNCWFRYEEV